MTVFLLLLLEVFPICWIAFRSRQKHVELHPEQRRLRRWTPSNRSNEVDGQLYNNNNICHDESSKKLDCFTNTDHNYTFVKVVQIYGAIGTSMRLKPGWRLPFTMNNLGSFSWLTTFSPEEIPPWRILKKKVLSMSRRQNSYF